MIELCSFLLPLGLCHNTQSVFRCLLCRSLPVLVVQCPMSTAHSKQTPITTSQHYYLPEYQKDLMSVITVKTYIILLNTSRGKCLPKLPPSPQQSLPNGYFVGPQPGNINLQSQKSQTKQKNECNKFGQFPAFLQLPVRIPRDFQPRQRDASVSHNTTTGVKSAPS